MRIMIATDQFFPMVGGVPAVTRSLAEGLGGRGHAVTIVAPGYRDLDEAPAMAGVRVYRCPSFEWSAYEGQRIALLSSRRLRRFIVACAPDIVHVHSLLVLGALTRTAAIRAHKPVIATHHYLPINMQPSLMSHPLLRTVLAAGAFACMLRFYNRCAFVTAPTATGLGPLVARGLRPPSRPVSNGVDLTRFSPGVRDDEVRRCFDLPTDGPLILYLNRLSPEKCPGLLVEAAARMEDLGHIAVAGTGPLAAGLRAQAQRLQVDDRVTFLGFVPDDILVTLYRAADIFVIPSVAELQSLVTMEAMACGLPIVASNAQALPELVHHGENGFLFPAGDTSVLASYLDTLVGNASLRTQMGARSLEIIRTHDREMILTQWEALYHATIHGEAEEFAAEVGLGQGGGAMSKRRPRPLGSDLHARPGPERSDPTQ